MTDASPQSIGFIGLGVMGYPMAQNLLSKLPPASNLYIFDVSRDTLRRFAKEADNKQVTICESSKQVAEKSVGVIHHS